MFNLFRYGPHFGNQQSPLMHFGGGLFFNGLLCVLFGIAILNAPELLAYFVAILLLILGTWLLTMWWQMRQWKK